VGLKEKLKVVCGDCNSGWMSALTEKMKKRFAGAILDGSPFSLDVTDAALLAAFTLMKATVKDYCYSNDVFFARAARERLRTELTIPNLVKMWIAAYEGTARYTFQSNINVVTVSTPSPLYGIEFFCYTYIVGKLVLQLLAPRWESILDRGKPLVTLKPHIHWQPAAIQFWPFPKREISWPPEKYLGDSVIEQFLYRFHVPIVLR
jgi:hypothetical protein